MREFFYPDRIAVVGVSENLANLARGIVAHLLSFGCQGKIYPVGPRGGKAFGLPILSQIEDLPEPVDLAAILTPARFVPPVVEACGKLGISRIVVESGGFSELGEQGQALDNEIRSLLRQYDMPLVAFGAGGAGTVRSWKMYLCGWRRSIGRSPPPDGGDPQKNLCPGNRVRYIFIKSRFCGEAFDPAKG